MEIVRYRLLGDKQEGTWSMRGGNALKNGRMKSINYYPGSDSIFDEDNRETSIKPRTVIFRYNDTLSDPAIEINVALADRNLIDYLEAHPFNGRFYQRYDPEEVAREKLEKYNNIEKALACIKESDEQKSKAIGLAILGFEYLSFSTTQVKMLLRERATEDPLFIISRFESDDYKNRYFSCLAYSTGVIRSNSANNLVVWSDNGGKIVRFAKGENPIDKLTVFLKERSEESLAFYREVESRFSKIFEREYAETTDYASELRWKFKTKTGKDVPLRFKNDVDWMLSKLRVEN